MSRVSVRGIAVASATTITAVGAVVGISGAGVSASEPEALDNAGTTSTSTLLLAAPSTAQAETLTQGITQQADAQKASFDEAQRKAAEEADRLKAQQEADAKAKAEADAKAKAEADAKEKADRDKAQKESDERASRSNDRNETLPISTGDPKAIAKSMMSAGQFQCFSNIVTKESGWNPRATNKSSGAYGLVQALPASKMASAGADWRTNPATQIKWGLNYMNQRYGSPCDAWSFWQSHHWY